MTTKKKAFGRPFTVIDPNDLFKADFDFLESIKAQNKKLALEFETCKDEKRKDEIIIALQGTTAMIKIIEKTRKNKGA